MTQRSLSRLAPEPTARRSISRAPARYRRGLARFRALYAEAPIGAMLCRPDGLVLDSNATVAELLADLDLDPGDLHLDMFTSLLDSDDAQRWLADLDAIQQSPSAHSVDAASAQLGMIGADGRSRSLEIAIVPLTLGDQDYLLAHLRDLTGRRSERARLVYLATHDALTGLPNRELIQQQLATALDRSRHTQRPVAVLYLDLDHFKTVNDTHGHHVGDGLLTALGHRLRSVLRASDSAGRLGGDEFLVVAPGVPSLLALAELQRRIEVCLAEPVEVETMSLMLQPSIGAVLSREAEQPGSVIRRADAAMYAAKRAARRRHRALPPVSVTRAQQQMVWEQAGVAGRR